MSWNHYRDEVWTLRNDTNNQLRSLLSMAEKDGQFPNNCVDNLGEPRNSDLVRAERASQQIFKLLTEIGHYLTLPMTAEEASDAQIPQ